MAKKMIQQRGVLANPRYTNEIVTVNSKGVITLARANKQLAKRPSNK